MIVERILGNLADLSADELQPLHVERVVLPLSALTKRVQRVTSDHGREIGIRLTDRVDLHDGDILVRDDHGLVVVALEPTDVLVIAPDTILSMAVVAHSLGNRHMQAQFFGPGETIPGLEAHDGVMVVPYDHTAEHYLQHQQVRYLRTDKVMPVPFRHAEHTH